MPPLNQHLIRSNQTLLQGGIVMFCLVLTGIVWGALITELSREREQLAASQKLESEKLVQLFQEHVERTLAIASVTFQEIENEYARQGNRIDLGKYLQDRKLALEPFKAILVIDGNHDLQAASFPIQKAINAGNTPNAQHHAQNTDLGIFVAKPRNGKASGTFSMVISQRINNPDGSYGGFVAMNTDPTYFPNSNQICLALFRFPGLKSLYLFCEDKNCFASLIEEFVRYSDFGQD